MGIEEVPALKAAAVMEYFGRRQEEEDFPATQRIAMIWAGMRVSGVDPHVQRGAVHHTNPASLLDGEDLQNYHELDSVGVAVCVQRGLLNTCEETKYALSATGLEFIQGDV